jgi:hypothetical protein
MKAPGVLRTPGVAFFNADFGLLFGARHISP